MTTSHAVTLIVGLVASTAAVLGPILLYLVKIRHENQVDHAKVVTSVDVLAVQVATLTRLVVDSTSQLKAHTMWEESQKYASPEHIRQLIDAVREPARGGLYGSNQEEPAEEQPAGRQGQDQDPDPDR
jgi:flagellar motor component MotA